MWGNPARCCILFTCRVSPSRVLSSPLSGILALVGGRNFTVANLAVRWWNLRN